MSLVAFHPLRTLAGERCVFNEIAGEIGKTGKVTSAFYRVPIH
jgi:hypothetical protein